MPTDAPIIDCDIHNVVPSIDALLPFLSEHWREYIRQSAFKGAPDNAYPPQMPTTARPDARSASGAPGSSLDVLRAQVLDAWPIEFGILNCAYSIDSIHNPDAAAAVAAAVNDWQLAEWLDKEPRLRASVVAGDAPRDVDEPFADQRVRAGPPAPCCPHPSATCRGSARACRGAVR